MKKLILFTIGVFGVNAMFSQIKTDPQAPKVPKDSVEAPSVAAEDPMEKAAWKRQKKNGKAEFSDSTLKKDRTVTYDATGNMVISDNSNDPQANPDSYPPSIGEYYTQKFPGEKYRVLWTKDKIGNKVYYVTRKTEVFWFDQDGKFNSKTKSVSKK